jgi:hypothetical protein
MFLYHRSSAWATAVCNDALERMAAGDSPQS